ncbi:CPBP family intramembrane glutamic endopeptidase [Thermococcus sp. 2319x1]|uniref:CPBP family intramembrane glutamic endopeptidase n=1 Tax=Thermococcus sp. 2319x1 TaxID=1674923 RepID=UPI0009E72D75
MLFLGGPLQEEFGWRGYASPRLQANHSALVSSVIIGVLWAFWHLPLNFMSDKAGPQYEAALSMFLAPLPRQC